MTPAPPVVLLGYGRGRVVCATPPRAAPRGAVRPGRVIDITTGQGFGFGFAVTSRGSGAVRSRASWARTDSATRAAT